MSDPVDKAVQKAHRLMEQSDKTGWELATLGISIAVAGLKKNADADEIAKRFPRFIWALNDALNQCVSGDLQWRSQSKRPRCIDHHLERF